MKKVLLLSLGLVMGFSAFAQNRVVKTDMTPRQVTVKNAVIGNEVVNNNEALNYVSKGSQSVVVNRYSSFEEAESMMTTYDLQSNGFVSNRMYQLNNGSVAVTATFSQDGTSGASDRGTGYNFCANGSMNNWLEAPDSRIEDTRTGWPSIAPYGANGEILVNHSSSTNYYIRETAGEGEWQYLGTIPNPTGLDGQEYDFALTWPRVITSGENNEIIHVFAASQVTGNDGTTVTAQFYCRSNDGQNWDVQWSPLAGDDEHIGSYSADSYSLSANGNTVAVVYAGSLRHHLVMYKSTDNGENWERTVIWENPYYGFDWEEEGSIYTDTLSGPAHASVAVGVDGVAHVAISTYAYKHGELGDTYSIWSGLMSDGIRYWNDTQEAPIQAVDGNPHHALKCFFFDGGYLGEESCDSTLFCGWIPPHPELWWSEYNAQDNQYSEQDYFYAMYGTSAYPSISVDPAGNLAVAYSAPDLNRGLYNDQYYFRTVYFSFKAAGEDMWMVATDQAFEDFLHMYDEGVSVSAVSSVVNENEFWFSYLADDQPGFFMGTNTSQASASDNIVYVVKIGSEYIVGVDETIAKDVVYNVYPNPASEYIFVSSSMDAAATVTFTNLAGQTVKVVNTNLTTGENGVAINDLNSGVYFCTVTANGYSHTAKVVVK